MANVLPSVILKYFHPTKRENRNNPQSNLEGKDRCEQIFNGEELWQKGGYPDSRNQSNLFYFIYFASSDLDALKYGHSEGMGQMTSFKQREGWKR